MRKIIATLLVGVAVAGGLVACGGDDDNNIVTPGSDSGPGNDGSPNNGNDGSPNNGNDGSPNMGTDGGDAGPSCAFTAFVIDQVTNHTNGTDPAASVTGLDPSCSTTEGVAPFAGLIH